MIKKIFSALCVVLFAASMMAQTGLTCEDAIPVDKNYVGTIPAEGEYWFTAYTYDLPLNVHFSPVSDNSDWGPEVYVDFTCTPGVYEDHKLDSVINGMTDFGLELPVEFLCDRVVRNGKVEWDLSINENYRENLTRCGITENVQAFVRVYFSEPGEIRLKPDTSYQSCMENERVKLGDTLDILPNDADRVFVFPYSEWKKDSIQFTWIGDGSATIWVSDGECEFTPVSTSAYVKAQYTTSATAPYKLQPADIDAAVQNWLGGGVYFAKVMAKSAGKLVVEKIPLGPIQGDAILLKHNQLVELNANDERVFCFPKSWKSTEFLSTASRDFQMYVSNTCDFTPSSSDANVFANYTFGADGTGRRLQLSTADISTLGTSASDDYLYVRFNNAEATTLTPMLWDANSCAKQSILITSGETRTILARSSSNLYRLQYDDWEGGDITIKWTGYSTLPTYIAEGCSFMLSSTDSNVLTYLNIRPRATSTITSTSVDAWSTHVDEEGFLYVRFNPTNKGNVTFTSIKPEPVLPDTIYTTITETLCYGESYEWNGQSYSTAGEYKQSFTATNGADSIVTLQLTILPEVAPVTEEATIEAGESYTWNGKEYTEAGEYTITLQDKNGCDYQATLVLKVNKPLSPCLQSSIKLNVGDEVVINLDSAFTVYAIDYAAWMAQPVTLVWTGAEALHTFVAETCVFALAPYNKYVHAYVPVPAQGDSALDMETLAPYVDEDGYLYVRFLTEFEGVLTVDN